MISRQFISSVGFTSIAFISARRSIGRNGLTSGQSKPWQPLTRSTSSLSNAGRQERRDIASARDQAQRHWQGAQRFQRLLLCLLWSPTLDAATTNAAEHVFRCLRRYTHHKDHLGTEDATQRFFDLFAFYYNVRILRAGKHEGNSLLASARMESGVKHQPKITPNGHTCLPPIRRQAGQADGTRKPGTCSLR